MKILKEIKRQRIMLKIKSKLWIKESLFADFQIMKNLRGRQRISKFNKNVYNWNKNLKENKKLNNTKMFLFYKIYSKNNKI